MMKQTLLLLAFALLLAGGTTATWATDDIRARDSSAHCAVSSVTVPATDMACCGTAAPVLTARVYGACEAMGHSSQAALYPALQIDPTDRSVRRY